ncbi:MAG: RNA polymerase sigma factor, partial [Bacteroidia bacterium]|nr:RNA polymerase sigma factor [Bacteroidia bacterium]
MENQTHFEKKLEELQPTLKNYALQLSQNMDDANDLVQETLMKAIIYSSKFK